MVSAMPIKKRLQPSQSGFTLIEILIVVAIIGILAGLVVPKLLERPEEARRVKARIQIEQIQAALKLYYLDNGSYPTTEQGLEALIQKPPVGKSVNKWRPGGYLEGDQVPVDPWGYPYQYLSPGLHSQESDIWSMGPDGVTGGEGDAQDVESWRK